VTALEAFRDSTRTWLEENCPPSMRTPMVPEEIVWGGRDAEYVNPESKLWLDRMGEKGWTCPTWPQEYGGGGLSKEEAAVLKDELGRIDARIALTSFRDQHARARCYWSTAPTNRKWSISPRLFAVRFAGARAIQNPGAGI
jgi:alkylation response protein AidB-like acyl-CoA dehydrogenase